MKLSVVIITKNEAPRLKLCLASVIESLARIRSDSSSIVVVDDCSDDETQAVLADCAREVNVTAIRHSESRGRSASRNGGVAAAEGDIILFLDGDTLISPETCALHLQAHQASASPIIARGIAHHVRQTRFLRDPQTGEPFPLYKDRPVQQSELVTEAEVRSRFDTLVARTSLGIYPGIGPRSLAELELAALRDRSIDHSLWMAMIAHNVSLSRAAFLECGGFVEELSMNEHRELALSLSERKGIRVRLVENALSVHLCHAVQWRDPLASIRSWEALFLERHPTPEAKLLTFFWLSLAPDSNLPEELAITSLPELIRRAAGNISAYDYFRATSPIFRGGGA